LKVLNDLYLYSDNIIMKEFNKATGEHWPGA
jgi:hypothetical protein